MKILLVSQYFPPEPFKVGDLALALRDRGHQVTVLTGYPNYPNGRLYEGYKIRGVKREDYHGIEVIRVPIFADTSYSSIRRSLNFISFFISGSLLGPLVVSRDSYDQIITFQLSPITIGIPSLAIKLLHFKRAPIYHWILDIWPESLMSVGISMRSLPVKAIRVLAWLLYKAAHRIIVPSKGFIGPVTRYGIRSEKIHYLPNWAEDLYSPVPQDPDFGVSEDLIGGFKVIFAGNIGEAQGLDVLVGAAEILVENRDIRLILYGDGANLAKLQEVVTRKGLNNVEFRGRRPAESMPQVFAYADVLLVQLKRDPLFALTIPWKIPTYMACRRPLIAGLEGSGAELVQEANAGIICEPGNPQALADAILTAYRMPAEARERLAENAYDYYGKHFTRDRVFDELCRVMEEGANGQ